MTKTPNALTAYLSPTWSTVSITSLVGIQPIKLTLYSQQDLDREVIVAMKVSHVRKMTAAAKDHPTMSNVVAR